MWTVRRTITVEGEKAYPGSRLPDYFLDRGKLQRLSLQGHIVHDRFRAGSVPRPPQGVDPEKGQKATLVTFDEWSELNVAPKPEPQPEPEPEPRDDAPEGDEPEIVEEDVARFGGDTFPKQVSENGWYELSNGESVRGEDAARAAQAELDDEG